MNDLRQDVVKKKKSSPKDRNKRSKYNSDHVNTILFYLYNGSKFMFQSI